MSDVGVSVLYCDLDGTIRLGKDELGRFVNLPEDVQIFDGVTDLLWRYRSLGWRIVGISNQAGVGLGYMSKEDCSAAMDRTNQLTQYAFDKIMWCEHKPNAGCLCRKPGVGMLVEARLNLQKLFGEFYPPDKALFVGDRPEDKQCAENVGMRFMYANQWRDGIHLQEITL